METLKFTIKEEETYSVSDFIFPFLMFVGLGLGFPLFEIYFEKADVDLRNFRCYKILHFSQYLLLWLYSVLDSQFQITKSKGKMG